MFSLIRAVKLGFLKYLGMIDGFLQQKNACKSFACRVGRVRKY
jgi:hypothetical protein